MGIAHYLWKAFTRPWNLLFVLGASAAAAMTPAPDVLLPLIVAGEAIYLGALVSLPRFRLAIDAQDAERARAQGHKNAPSMNQLLASLRAESQKRFNDLRVRCLEMRSIARGARPVTVETDVWTPSLDRLLYGFLRLLGQQNSLWRFLRSTSADELTRRLEEHKNKLVAAKASGDDRMIRSLEESIAIAEQRLDNYQKAVKNAEFAALELDRVETKIQALIELAANRGDAALVSDQVDAAAESMHHTEAALNQLQQITGVTDELDEVPPILDDASKQAVKDRG